MVQRIGEGLPHFLEKRWIALGLGVAAFGTAAVAAGEVRPLGDLLRSSDKPPVTNHRRRITQPSIPHELLQQENQQIHIRSYGHSMLHVDGQEVQSGTQTERSVDFHLASILNELYPNHKVTHDNSAVVGSLSTDMLKKLQADRDELINFPGIMIHVVYTGENDWKDVLTGEESMRHLEGLSQLSDTLPRGVFIREAATNGVPIAHSHRGVEKKLSKAKLAIFEEYKRINNERRKKGHPPIYIAALESADFSKAKAITMYPPEGVNLKSTLFPLDTEYARRAARVVSESNTKATRNAVRSYRRSVPATLVSIRGVEAFFGEDQHVGEGGQEYMAFQTIYDMHLIPASAVSEVA